MTATTVAANKKKQENGGVRNVALPTVESEKEANDGEKSIATSGVLLLSLLQSRQNYLSRIFPSYIEDPVQQPKRVSTSRRKWPNMKYLGHGTVHLGPHIFLDTTFYEARRQEMKSQPPPNVVNDSQAEISNSESTARPAPGPDVGAPSSDTGTGPLKTVFKFVTGEDLKAAVEKSSNAATSKEKLISSASSVEKHTVPSDANVNRDAFNSNANQTLQSQEESPAAEVVDIVFEFKENPGERFVLPRKAIFDAVTFVPPLEILLSFHLPLEPYTLPSFLSSPQAKSEHRKSSKTIQNQPSYATTMRISGISDVLFAGICRHIGSVGGRQQHYEMTTEKMRRIPSRQYLRYKLSDTVGNDTYEEIALSTFFAANQPYQRSRTSTSRMARVRTLSVHDLEGSPAKRARIKSDRRSDFTIQRAARPAIPENPYAITYQPRKPPVRRSPIPLPTLKARSSPRPPISRQSTPADSGGIKKCGYCGTRSTPMWRRGPHGAGTLCNACGVKWKQGKILRGVEITYDQDSGNEGRGSTPFSDDGGLTPSPSSSTPIKQVNLEIVVPPVPSEATDSIGDKAPEKREKLMQVAIEHVEIPQATRTKSRSRSGNGKSANEIARNGFTKIVSVDSGSDSPVTKPRKAANTKQTKKQNITTSAPVQANRSIPPSSPDANPTAIPLPTLSVEFPQIDTKFIHPQCGVTLFGTQLQIRLQKEGHDKTAFVVAKQVIQQVSFEVVKEEDDREVLIASMHINLHVNRFDENLLHPGLGRSLVRIRFLEKLDQQGDGVVKRILERVLA
ncbi:hypothetical protein BZG36_01774 [Bifiguratus adelaidae]|uniref:GATA-type domain-containing protein n=1 Tax=Bifiguratus adelaidae TaxID=1938954 RepID=A0A261Y2Y6_9FUNG|nr:hypothetical protein BZG36_01774 [Bifiguratus adelaidae]